MPQEVAVAVAAAAPVPVVAVVVAAPPVAVAAAPPVAVAAAPPVAVAAAPAVVVAVAADRSPEQFDEAMHPIMRPIMDKYLADDPVAAVDGIFSVLFDPDWRAEVSRT
ncbi:MAG TPA: hypothetical protein VF003_19555, partial [Pseudonocardiaceae bacterium]